MYKANQQFQKGETVTGLENRPEDHLTPLQSFFFKPYGVCERCEYDGCH
jgi:hypothetical protein